MPISRTSLLAQTAKIVHLHRIWFSFLAFRNNRWIARLFTVAFHKLPVSKLLYYLWNKKITKKYLSWLLPAGEPLPEKLFIQICVWEQRSLLMQLLGFIIILTIVCFMISCDPGLLCSWAGISCTRTFAVGSRYLWTCKGVRGKKKQHTYMLQRSARNQKYLKPCCFAMTMMKEILLMWY